MKYLLFLCVAGLGSGVVAAQTPVGTSGTEQWAGAVLVDTGGRSVGEARLQQTPHGVLLTLDLRNATPGVHGMHIHEVGRCDPPAFDSAGGHFDAAKREHGFLNPRGPHAGDLPNIDVPASRQFSAEYLMTGVTLDRGPKSLLDADGSAVVIHNGKDNHLTDPAGDTGDRIACGPIVAAAKG
jgi:Cu-Zn family superoxide dismutase